MRRIMAPRFFSTVRFRLTLWYLAALAVVLGIFGTSVYYIQQQYLTTQFDDLLHTRLQQIALTYDAATHRLDIPATPPGAAASIKVNSRAIGGEEVALLFSPEGEPLQQFGDLSQRSMDDLTNLTNKAVATIPHFAENSYTTQAQLQVQFRDGKVPGVSQEITRQYGVASMAIQQKQQVVAYLTVGIPSTVAEQLSTLETTLLLVSPLVLLLAALGGFWLAGRAMHPVQAITATAQQIEATDLSRRIAIKRGDELGELATTFDTMLDRLEGAFTRQRQFTADASHELRTPLTIIQLETDRLLAQRETTDRQRASLAVIQQEREHMAHLVDDLLFLARADVGHAIVRHEAVPMDELILEVAERFAPLASERHLHVLVDTLPDLTVLGDRLYLARMLGNLVENALKYSGPQGTCVAIALTACEQSGSRWAKLTVCDDGQGIAAEDLPHVFERFYRADTARTHDGPDAQGEERAGSGLGLAIARRIVETHGGTLTLDSDAGRGVTCTVLLPVQPR